MYGFVGVSLVGSSRKLEEVDPLPICKHISVSFSMGIYGIQTLYQMFCSYVRYDNAIYGHLSHTDYIIWLLTNAYWLIQYNSPVM